ncbi:MAG: ABC transporter permease [Halomonas sp.]|uniref:ABC transporter permease n=1 Tax=Halomonas sp. TaxID=1486246 RepID=UPI003F8DDF8F
MINDILLNFYDLIENYGHQFLSGLYVTLKLLLVTTIFGFLLAVPIGLALTSRIRIVRSVANIYSIVFRGSPIFVQLFLIYYGLPALLIKYYGSIVPMRESIWWTLTSSPFTLASLAFILNLAAYMAEDIRGGLQSVPNTEKEAAIAYGMHPLTIARNILLPSALRRAMPALFNQVIISLKATVLVSTIAMQDLMGVGSKAFAQTFDITIYLFIAIIYLAMVFGLSRIFRTIEKHAYTSNKSGLES